MTSATRAFTRLPAWAGLLLISFATLFFEILVIRWVASEIRIFAFMKNLCLMGCVLGMGIGCACVSKDNKQKLTNCLTSFAILMTILAAVLTFAPALGLTNISFIITGDIFNWQFNVSSVMGFFFNVLCTISLFLLVVAMFDQLGQELGKHIAEFPPLKGYGINLFGSLLGVVIFSLMCFVGTSPTVWLVVGLLSLIVLCANKRQALIFALLSAVTIILAYFCVGQSIWSPYYRIDLKPLNIWYHHGVEVEEPFRLGTVIEVNHMKHQAPFDFSKEFFNQHPQLYTSSDYMTYNLPYAAKPHPGRVLVLGAGSGNDVAVCLQHNPQIVDAVEIDPGILKLGRSIHPMLPYADARVHPYINDARAYLSSHANKYDLIVFGYLDSHTALSTMSSLRLDNYLYTRESLQSVTQHLNDNGIASLSFSAQPLWLQARLYQMVKSVYGKEPLVIRTGFAGGNSLAILWGPGLPAVQASLEEKYADAVIPLATLSEPVALASDDWPFLYQRDRNVPLPYIAMLILVMLISTFFVVARFRLKGRTLIDNAQFFFLGAGFLLLETRGMLAVAVLFGSTWIVNSIVIGIILLMAMLSNLAVMRFKKIDERFAYGGLLLFLALAYFVPLSSFVGASFVIRALAALVLIGAPCIWSGIVFSRAFSRSTTPQLALGVNILGAILGGCLEYLSTITGIASLALIALAIYALSAVFKKHDLPS